MNVVAYVRVSTAEQAASGLGREAQVATLTEHAERMGWTIVAWFVDDGVSTRGPQPAREQALAVVQGGDADGLVVAKIDRLCRSTLELCQIVEQSQKKGWTLAILQPALTLSKDDFVSTLIAHVLGAVGEFERAIIGQRTKEALAAAAARGVQIGRRREIGPEVEEVVQSLLDLGMSQRKITAFLDGTEHAPPRGGDWSRATVQRLVERLRAREPIE